MCELNVRYALLAIACAFCAVMEVDGQENKPAANSAGKVEVAKDSLLDQMQTLASAGTLIRYGRENKDPEALIVAAKMISGIVLQDLTKRLDKEAKLDLPQSKLTPADLLDEAAKLGAGKAHIEASIAAAKSQLAETRRGRPAGPFGLQTMYPANRDVTVPETFAGFNRVDFSCLTPNAIVHLQVVNASGQSLGDVAGPGPFISWFGTGTFFLRFHNPNPFPVEVVISTN